MAAHVTMGNDTCENQLVTFKSYDKKIATIDASGRITGNNEGTTTITATSPNGVSASCTINVKRYMVDEVTVGSNTYLLNHEKLTAALKKAADVATITIPDTVEANDAIYAVDTIADKVCKGMKKLKTLKIGANVTTIGKNAFAGCTKLTKVSGGKKVKTIGTNAFSGCTGLASVAEMKGASTISDGAFQKTGLKSFAIGSKVTVIGKNASAGCTKLTKVTGGSALTAIGDSAFAGDTKLSSLPSFAKLTAIGANAFKNCKTLKKIELGSKVKSIGKSAFLNCSKLSSVVIKTKLLTKSSVGASAFKGIYKKAVVTVPSSKLKDYTAFLFKKGVPKTAKFTK